MRKLNLLCRIFCWYFILYFLAPAYSWAAVLISPPTFPSGSTVEVTLSGTASTNAYIIFSTPDLATNASSWTRVVTGSVGQVTFDLSKPTNDAVFYRAGVAPISTPTVATPVLTPGGGSYPMPTNVVITCSTVGAAIYYTTNGNTPTTLDNYIYSGGSVYLASSTTLKAKAFAFGFNDSAVASATYSINSPPSVDAGAQQVITSSSTTLQGFVTDDGLGGGGTTFTNWTQISGPGTVTFGNAHQTNSTASFSANGIYVLQLSASDGQYTNSSEVTIAVNPTLSVSMTAPTDGSSYTVPTNFLLQATASCSSGSVTQLLFYANSTLIGQGSTSDGNTFSLQWKDVFSGNLALTAVAISSDPDNFSLASDPVNISVAWPTNVGQVTIAQTDLQIPSAGLPITVNRQYDTRYGASGSFGNDWKFDFENIKIEKSAALDTGWRGTSGGFGYGIQPTTEHLITVTLGPDEHYYFVAQLDFDLSGSPTINSSVVPDGYNSFWVHLECVPTGQGQLTVAAPNDGNDDTVGMDSGTPNDWNEPLTASWFDSLFGLPTGNTYNPDFSQFTFTAPDGTKYGFNGDGSLAWHSDRNGNTLSYSSSGIFSSTGRQITFTRDGNNRVTEVYDPIAINNSGSPVLTYAYDSNGNLTNVAQLVQRSPAVYENTAYAYTNTDFPSNITAVTDARGVVSAAYEYDSEGRLYRQYDAYSHPAIYTYDIVNRRNTFTDRNGHTTVQTFNPGGEIASVQDAAGNVTTYNYDPQGNKTSATDATGQTTTYAYDSNGLLIGQTNALNQSASTTYNGFGEALVSIDNNGGGTTNAYDPNGNLLFTTNALGVVTAYGYDFQGNRTGQTNALGLAEEVDTTNSYSQFGDLMGTGTLNPQGQLLSQTSFTYDDDGNKSTQTKLRTLPNGSDGSILTQWQYDAANRLIQAIDGNGYTNLTVYNPIGKQSQTVDGLGRTNSYYYDLNGLLTNTTYADGLFESYSYDFEGHKITSTDRGGHTTRFNYDPLGRLTQTTYPDENYSQTGYDGAGRVSQTAQVEVISQGPLSPPVVISETTSYTYDAAGNRTSITNALNQGMLFTYDANGNQTSVIDALGHTNITVFDALNRPIKHIYPDSTSESDAYDGIGRKVAVTNQANIVTRFAFDALGRLVAVTNAFGTSQQTVTTYSYDEVGNLLAQVDALNRTNKFEYDALGHRTKESLPGGQAQTFGYDADGNMIYQTNFNATVITNQYDVLNRVMKKSSANGYLISYLYSPTGQPTNMVDASGTNTYTYDSRDRLLTKATPEGAITYTYDGFGNVATMQSTTTNGTSLAYSYDLLNRLTGVTDRFTNSTAYTFDSVGNLQTAALPNGVTNTYSYDSLNRLTNITSKTSSGTIASFDYKLAPFGNRTNLAETINGVSRTNIWAYDPLYRLTNETIVAASGGNIAYKYDAVGNRTNRTSTVGSITNQSIAYNLNDELTTDIYDANGNTRTNGSNTFSYDAENRLTNAIVGGTNIVIVYDGNGNRVKKIVGSTTNYYLVDDRNPTGYAQVLEDLTTVGGTPARLYTYGLDLISQRQSGGTTSFYGHDGNGNTRFLTSASGTVSDTYAYDAFGDLIASTGSTPNNYLYTGAQYDPNMGFYYLRARYMNPNTGRFWTRDAFAGNLYDPVSLHKYLYAGDNPPNQIDPSGHQGEIAIGIGLTEILLALITIVLIIALVHVVAKVDVIDIEDEDTTGLVLFHYSPYPDLTGPTIWEGTWLTDRGDLTASVAQKGLGLGSLPTTLYEINVKTSEVKGPFPIEPSSKATIPIDALQWFTDVSLPISRIINVTPVPP